MDKLFNIGYYAKVTFHPYRTMSVYNVFLTIKRYSDAGRELEDMLVKAAKAYPDNHCCFTVEQHPMLGGPTIHYHLSDGEIRIGMGIKKCEYL